MFNKHMYSIIIHVSASSKVHDGIIIRTPAFAVCKSLYYVVGYSIALISPSAIRHRDFWRFSLTRSFPPPPQLPLPSAESGSIINVVIHRGTETRGDPVYYPFLAWWQTPVSFVAHRNRIGSIDI